MKRQRCQRQRTRGAANLPKIQQGMVFAKTSQCMVLNLRCKHPPKHALAHVAGNNSPRRNMVAEAPATAACLKLRHLPAIAEALPNLHVNTAHAGMLLRRQGRAACASKLKDIYTGFGLPSTCAVASWRRHKRNPACKVACLLWVPTPAWHQRRAAWRRWTPPCLRTSNGHQ